MEGITAKQVIDYLEQHEILLTALAMEMGDASQCAGWHEIGLDAVHRLKAYDFYRSRNN